ncbi:cytochrome d ubiquinol oxidase subunit II [Streptomyces harbinensis]|uniref:cytochrome d ubiquinol oxidase subunit II n=1 Tax=Streptomyces harbinensis TaxID=1176198 RepID=UPI0036D0FEA3
METLAIGLLGFFTAGYFALAGADLGLGMLLPLLGRDRADRDRIAAALAPYFLGSEVWLVAAAGVFIGCFPELEGELFTELLPVLVLLLAGWIVRDAGLWWRVHGGRAPDVMICAGSWTVVAAWGWALAGLLGGAGGLALATVAGVALLFAAHGLGYGALRLTGEPYRRARQLAGGPGRGQTFALTGAVLAALPLLAGAGLPLRENAAAGPVLGLLVPALTAFVPVLLAAQLWLWRATARTGPREGAARTTTFFF